MNEIVLIAEFLTILGERVFFALMKIVDGETYYSVEISSKRGINSECIDVCGSEEFAMDVYNDIKARAMRGPVGEVYLFPSDEEREEALAEYKQFPSRYESRR